MVSTYDEKKYNKVLNLISEGNSVLTIGKIAGLPSHSTIHKRIRTDEEFATNYREAKEIGLKIMADEIQELSDRMLEDTHNGVEVQKLKLMIDSRKWLLAKLVPKKYGDRVDLNHGGQDGNPLITKVERVIIDNIKKDTLPDFS